MEFVHPIRGKKKINKMKRILRRQSIRNYCIFVLGINSALRVSDLLVIKIGDVVDGFGKVKSSIVLREKKTGKTKQFKLSPNARKAISELVMSKGIDVSSPEYPLFQSRKKKNGKPQAITRIQLHKILKDAAKEAGIEDNISTHSLRKTWAYHAYKAGVDIVLIQRALNHSSPRETLRYIGITQDQLDDVYMTVNL